jgi:metal-sulfur cluster biosynthetic enzyme
VREVVGRRSSVVGRGSDAPPVYPTPPERQTGALWDALREVMDPEIPISLVDLGLIYDVRLAGGVAEVDLTFTATACPCMAFIRFDIEERLLREGEVDSVRIREVWNPPWTKARITPRGREQMKQLGVSM